MSTIAHIAPDATGFGGAHGGYIAAIALRALTEVVDDAASSGARAASCSCTCASCGGC